MKKEYIKPITAVYKLRVISSFMTASQEHPDLNIGDGGGDDGGSGEADAREDNIDNNRGSIWDNAW